MKLNDILAVTGQPGLFKFVAQSPNGIIIESIVDGKRLKVSSTAKVSALGEIAIYTEGEDVPLHTVLTSMFEKNGGKEAVSHKSTPEELKKHFEVALPEYDKERVHVSDIKKVFSWYNLLVGAGMTDFSVEEPQQEEDSKEE